MPKNDSVCRAMRALIDALNPDMAAQMKTRFDAHNGDRVYLEEYLRTVLGARAPGPSGRSDELEPERRAVAQARADAEEARMRMYDRLEKLGGASDREVELSRIGSPRGRRVTPALAR